MVVVAECDKPKRLQRPIGIRADWCQHFGHPPDRSGLGLKSYLDKISLRQCPGQA